MDIDVVRPQDLTPEDVAAWIALLSEDPALDSPYFSPHWAIAVERAQACSHMDVRVAVLREHGRAVGFLPARLAGSTAMPAGAPMCDYQALVAAPGVKADPRRVLEAFGVSRYDFSHMLQSDPAFAGHIRGVVPSYVAEMPAGFDAYAADRSAFKDLGRKRRKGERDLGGAATFRAFSRSCADFERLIDWKRAQYRATAQTDIFEAAWTGKLLHDLFKSRDPDFGGVLFTLHFGERMAAAQFNLRGRKTVHCWIIAHDPDLEPYSPGMLLFQDILKWMDDTPYSSLDFGPGEYRFKKQLASTTRMIGHGFVGRPSPVTFARHAAYGVRAAAEALPLGRVSALPGKAMRRLDILRGLR